MSKFCPKCGAKEGDFYKGFCVKCYAELNDFLDVPKSIAVRRCHECKRIFVKNKFVNQTFGELEKIVKTKIKTTLFKPTFTFDLDDRDLLVTVHGSIDEAGFFPYQQTKRIPIEYKDAFCESCRKKSANYWESKIQIRHKEGSDDETILDRASQRIEKQVAYLAREDPEAEAFYGKHVREGIDLFFGSSRVAASVVQNMREQYKLRFEKSGQQWGVDANGKLQMRYTYCVRL